MTRTTITLIILWLGHFLVDFMIGIWPIYKTLANLDLAKAGFLVGFCCLIGEGMQIVFGSLSDRGYRKALILTGVLLSASASLFAYTQNYYFLFFMLMLTYMGSGAFHPSAVGLIGSLKSNRKSLLITIFATGGSLGIACSHFVYSYLFSDLGSKTILILFPVLLLVLCALFYRFSGTEYQQNSTKKIDLRDYVTCLKDRNIFLLFISQVSNQIFLWSTAFLLPDILLSRNAPEWITYGGGHLSYILGGVAMMIPGGYLADKYSSRNVIIVLSLVGAAFSYMFLLNQTLSPVLIITLLFLMGTMWTINPITVALGNKFMPDKPGVISALLMGMVWCISEGMGPGVGGLLTKIFHEDAPAKVLTLFATFLFISALAVSRLQQKQPAVAA